MSPKPNSPRLLACLLTLGTLSLLRLCPTAAAAEGDSFSDDFSTTQPLEARWDTREGVWKVNKDGVLQATGKFGRLVRRKFSQQDVAVTARVAYVHDAPHAAAGLQARLAADGTGYALCLREIERGTDPAAGPWERPLLQLFRMDKDGWKLLQEAKVMGARSGELRTLRLVCRGSEIYGYYEDLETPVIREADERYLRAGEVALWKDPLGSGRFDEITAGPVPETPPLTPPSTTDWSWVRGAVYVRSDAVNSVQMWHDYWDRTATLDRELSYASAYGFNLVQVYLHWLVWDRDGGEEYLKRIGDFLDRAAAHGLKVNFILWDDCGHVEPALEFAPPVPGRHNSQMMPNPAHAIRDSKEALEAHRDRFKSYVEGITGRFRDDPRIAFWQLYNEAMGPKERYRDGEADANLNTLLGWTREWVKGTGTQIPVTATGGGFYGAKQSDFPSYHSYRNAAEPLPNADGGPEHLCTETLNRPQADLLAVIRDLGGKRNGFVVWELMIGRDNCRFPWGHPEGPDEPATPFHGVIYPDGHPWDLAEVSALAGEENLRRRGWFDVSYYEGDFASLKKKSITPRIDFDLGDEPGTGSPDASTGIGKDHFSIRWNCQIVAPATGLYTFRSEGDGALTLRMGGSEVIAKLADGDPVATGKVRLKEGDRYPLTIDYVHGEGVARQKLSWILPDGTEQLFLPSPPEQETPPAPTPEPGH